MAVIIELSHKEVVKIKFLLQQYDISISIELVDVTPGDPSTCDGRCL